MRQKFVFATNNSPKLEEVTAILGEKVELLSMKDIKCDTDIPETADTLEGNALLKARYIFDNYHLDCFADDTGLEVEALGGAPGVYSARYMGEDTSYTIKNQNLLDRLNGVPKEQRTARFVCAIAAVLPDKETLVTRETIEGYIGFEPQGENGFGYDPIFYVDEYNCSTASLPPDKKNEMSHRGKALRAMKEALMGKGLS